MALNLSAFQTRPTSKTSLNLSAFGIASQVPFQEPNIALETIKGLPEAGGKVGKGILSFAKTIQEEIARSGASVALTGIAGGVEAFAPLTSKITGEREEDIRKRANKLREFDISDNPVAEVLFGERSLKAIETRIAEGELNVQQFGKDLKEGRLELPLLSKKAQEDLGEVLERDALPLSAFFIPLVIGMDFIGGGGIKNVVKQIAKSIDVSFIAKILQYIGVADDLVIPTAEKLAKQSDPKVVEKALNGLQDIQKATRTVAALREQPVAGRGARAGERVGERIGRIRGEEIAERQLRKQEFRALREGIRMRIRVFAKGVKEGRKVSKQEIKTLQDEVIGIAVGNLPVALRGSRNFLAKIRNATSPSGLEKALDDLSIRIAEFEETSRVLREQGTRRSKIVFVRKVGEFNQTTITDVKAEVGIQKPISKMNEQELDLVVNELRERLSFKMRRGFRPGIGQRGTAIPEMTDDIYVVNRDFQGQGGVSFQESIKQGFSAVGSIADSLGGSLSTRLANINPILKSRLRMFEFDARIATQADQKKVVSFLEKIRGKKVSGKRKGGMTQSDLLDFDLAVKNGDADKINVLANKYGFTKELADVRNVLDDLYRRANDVGFDIGYEKNYFPRIISDATGFLEYIQRTDNWSALGEAIKRKEMALGRYLTNEEKAGLINNMIRGYRGGQITLSKTGAMKSRVIGFVDPELNQFYARFDDALANYITTINEAIEVRKFFGKEFAQAVDGEVLNNLNDSIGSYTAKLLAEGKITLEQEEELARLLRARFGEKGITNPALGVYRTASYIDTLGGIDNALTQLGDLGFSIYVGGPRRGLSEGLKSFLNKSKITKEDLGFASEEISAEFREKGRLKKALDMVFRLTGFRKIDRIGLESLANSTIQVLQQQARNPDEKFIRKIEDFFPRELFGREAQEQVVRDLANNNITEDVKFIAFNNLLDFSPRALSEMPEKYLTGGNGRIFYMLQSWTLKLFDVYRREVWQQIAQGDKKQGLRNLFALTASVMAMNATADTLKDLLLGREIKPGDLFVDNMLKLAGFSRYTFFQVQREGLFSGVTAAIQPGASPLVDNASKDVINLFKDFDKSVHINQLRSVRSIPVGGDLYYWWFGKGTETKKRERTRGIEIPNVEIPSINVNIPNVEIPSISL